MDIPEEELADLIFQRLKGQRYLIVLDDVWSADAWFSIRMAFPDDNNGSRILITTRNEDVAVQIGCQSSYILRIALLSDDDSQMLFRHYHAEVMINPDIESFECRILRLCQGNPIAIILLAGSLKGRPLEEWKLAFEHLHDDHNFFAILNFCYQKLPRQLRACFLYLGNFPEDAEIETDTILRLWIAEGLISAENIRDGETMMDVAARYFDELVCRSFVTIAAQEEFLGRRVSSCSIHDLIREFCQKAGKNDGIVEVIDLEDNENKSNNGVSESSAFRRAIYLDRYEWSINAHTFGKADYLRTLLFFGSSLSGQGYIKPREISNLDHFIWLRVLSFFCVDFKDGKFPKGVEKLIYLRYLSFRECYLVELSSSVGKMLYLQTLDLRVRNEGEMTIPDVLDGLERLRYLYFPLAYQPQNQEGKLHLGRLTELELLDNFDPNVCNAGDLRGLANLKEFTVTTEGDISAIEMVLGALEKNRNQLRSSSLNIRNFDCHSKRRFSAMEAVFKSSAIHVLEVEGYLGQLPVLDRTSSKLTEIILNGSELVEDPMQILQDLPNLSILVLEIEAYTGEEMKCSSSGFLKLAYLKLSKLYNLKYWEVEEGAMPSLHTLAIENCKNLQMLPEGLKDCQVPKKLEIASMPEAFVERIQKSNGTEGEDFYKIKHVHSNVKIDGHHLILKDRQQAGPREDPQCSSTL